MISCIMHIPYSKWYFVESVWQGKYLKNNFQPKKYQVQNLGFKFLKYRGPCKREVRKGKHQQTHSLSSTKNWTTVVPGVQHYRMLSVHFLLWQWYLELFSLQPGSMIPRKKEAFQCLSNESPLWTENYHSK